MVDTDISLYKLMDIVANKAIGLTSEKKIHWRKETPSKYSAKLNNKLVLYVEEGMQYYHTGVEYTTDNQNQIYKGTSTEKQFKSNASKLYNTAEKFCDDYLHAIIEWVNEN